MDVMRRWNTVGGPHGNDFVSRSADKRPHSHDQDLWRWSSRADGDGTGDVDRMTTTR